ncbi:IQ domain-containing protein K isoform X5 [Macaca fascicularis]|uniref:IQ domain-containing protein K isoform X5 n=1 Tax=Macaca fascicularis TaxID=9541 RepID=UPI0032B02A98
MAAPRQVPSHTVPRKPSCSTDSSFTRTPVPTVSLGSRELPVSPWQVAEPSSKNLWEQICDEYEAEQPPFPEGYKVKQEPVITVAPVEEMLFHGFSAEHYFPVSHFTMISHTPCPQDKSETVNPKTCSPKEYLETFIFPVLLPGMASLLHQAKKEKCFEVRCDPEIQELRQWQKKLREAKHIHQRVKIFWAKQEQKGTNSMSPCVCRFLFLKLQDIKNNPLFWKHSVYQYDG